MMAAKQRNRTVTEYVNQLKSLLQKFDHQRVIKKPNVPRMTLFLRNSPNKTKVYDFLVKLNLGFDQVKIQIRGEKSKRSLMLEPDNIDNSLWWLVVVRMQMTEY